ncbi:MAG: uroporphyrinogen decarboxylase [Parvularculaceae bacterium]
MTKPFLSALCGDRTDPPPVWFMRQAGRYLPEYQALRKRAGSFVDFCLNPEMAAEATMQPIRCFDFDAAIIFADILLIPMAMGQELRFVTGEGPKLSPTASPKNPFHADVDSIVRKLSPVYETVARVRDAAPPEKAVIGFAGAPWTVATYMIAGGSQRDPSETRALYYAEPKFVEDLLDRLADATAAYLDAQIRAGADAVQLFESWAAGLPEELFRRFCIAPAQKICAAVKAAHPETPIICFPKGAGGMLGEYAESVGAEGVGVDTATPLGWARQVLPGHTAIQGALDPLLLIAGGEAMEEEIARQIAALRGRPHIFNLGHGITPQTPPEHVAQAIRAIRSQG